MTTEAELQLREESGAALLLAMGLVLLVVYLGVLVIDLARAEYITRELQRSADAASLAGATELVLSSNSDLDRWSNAKRAAIGILKSNFRISGYSLPKVGESSHHQGAADGCEGLGDYRSQVYDNSEIRIELERGVYSDAGQGTFVSLEDSGTCNAGSVPLPHAMRVTVTLYRYPTVFASLTPFGQEEFSALRRTAIGARTN